MANGFLDPAQGPWGITVHNQSGNCVDKIFDKITDAKWMVKQKHQWIGSWKRECIDCTLCMFLCADLRKLFNVESWSSVWHLIFFSSLMTLYCHMLLHRTSSPQRWHAIWSFYYISDNKEAKFMKIAFLKSLSMFSEALRKLFLVFPWADRQFPPSITSISFGFD